MSSSASPFYNAGQKLFKWNWGAFLDPLGFGYAHRAYKTFLLAIPSIIPCVLGGLWAAGIVPALGALASMPLLLVWSIACGAVGERMAWTEGLYEDGVAFRATMDSWNRAGRLRFVLTILILLQAAAGGAAAYFLGIFPFLRTM